MKLKTFWIAMLLLIGASASAAITTGNYLVKSYSDKYLTENTSSHALVCSDRVEGNYAQVWTVTATDNYVTFKNALTGNVIVFSWDGSAYITDAPSSSSAQKFYPVETDGVFTFAESSGGNWGLHCDKSNNVVGWNVSDEKSKWTVETAAVDSITLVNQQFAMAKATTAQLTSFFTDVTCTALNSTYSSYSDADLRTAMSALPTTVQDLAVKVKNNAWVTYSGWDKTEKTFRIATYKPYSSHTQWASILGLGYNFGRLTNPTGVSVSTGEVIQVYVGTIPSGQTVQLEVAGENQSTGSTYALEEGMNTLLMASAGNCFVQYEVDNTTNGAAPYTALSNYADVTVHIEGGTVNGYFDLTKGDDNDDWVQLQQHLLQGGKTVELKTGNLLFHMNAALVTSACPTKMVELLGEWDKILDMEHSLMGWEEYDGYWNNLLSCTDITDSYMYATNYGTYYNTSTIPSVMSYDALFAGGALWGPSHENGHVFQKYINMVGQTEVSNNVFSNVAIYNNGHLTSRAADISTTFQNMLDGVFWNDRDSWERTHLYFQLYQFFHILGKDPDFYPELFKAFRSDPMVHTTNTFISATDDYLKFYKKCCQVSGYDLTEFFQAYGFFVIPNLTSNELNGVTKDAYHVEDYGDYYLTVTQAEIDAVRAEVAAMNLPKSNIIFIEDRITAPAATYEGAAAGATKTAFSDEFPIGQSGETGQYTTFSVTPTAYKYNVIGTTVMMVGSGAVGFKVYDSTGALRGLYNTTTFTLPDGIGIGYTIKAAAGDGSDAAATLDATLGTTVSDVTEVPVAAGTVVAGSQVTAESQIVSGNLYLVYYAGNGSSAYMKDTGSAYTGLDDNDPTQNAVYRFTRNGDGTWKVQNYVTGKYWGTPTANNTSYIGVADEASAGAWALNFQSDGKIAPSCNEHSLNRSGSNIHPWSTGTAAANQLKIEAVSPVTALADDFTDKDISVNSDAAATLRTGQWYVMFDRGASHGYLYENGANQLYNTATVPSGSATENAKYLVRIVGWNNEYYLQTGLGHFFGNILERTTVPTTTTADNQITLKKIASTDGHYYLASDLGVILDANELSQGDATVVGWGAAAPTATGGNNDWAFYPVEFVESNPANRLVNTLTPLSAAPTGEGWYALIIKSGSYAGNAVSVPESEVAYQANRNYPLAFVNDVTSQPKVSNTTYYTRIVTTDNGYSWQLPNGLYLCKNGNNYFPTSTTDAVDNVSITYTSSGMQFSHDGYNATAYYLGSKYFIGETAGTTANFDVYPINLDDAGLTAWKVIINNAPTYAQLTCSNSAVAGLTSVYNNGFFFLPTGTTPADSDFSLTGMLSCTVDATNHTITADADPELSIMADDMAVLQGHQVTGKGNAMQPLLRVKATPFSDFQPTQFAITLSGAEHVDNVKVYATAIDQLQAANANPTLLGTVASPAEGTVTIPVTATSVSEGTTLYYWITVDVKSAATEWETIDASLNSVSYTNAYKAANSKSDTELDLSSIGNPDGEMRIYKSQSTLWTASQSNTQFYRIPTIINTADGGIAAFTDDRHALTSDLGNHKIDVVMRKSVDGGLTWSEEKLIAVGDGSSDAAFGYGDPAVVRTNSGKLICLMAAGKAGFSSASGMLHIGYTESTDNGATWSTVKDIYSSIGKSGVSFQSVFTTAGKGVTFSNGRVAFAMNGKVGGSTGEYILYSDDEGESWTISPTVAFAGADESKLEIMNDNSLLLSVRRGGYNSTANRGYNRTTGDASEDGVDAWGTSGIWGDMNANGCNADILYYNRETEDASRPDVIFHTLTKSFSTYRKDLRLYMSFDQGTTWQEAFHLQPGYAAYSSMQKLANGDLAIIFEDGSIGNEDKMDCYDINYVTISSELLAEKIDELYDDKYNPLVKNSVQGSTTGANSYGSFSDVSSTWAKIWTSNANSGIAGLTISANSNVLNHASVYNQRCFAMRPSADGATDEITITAPDGYYIDSYTITGRNYSDKQTYQLYVDENAKTTTSPSGATFSVNNVNAQSTSFKFYGSSSTSNYLCVTNFTIQLRSKYPVTLNTVGEASYATLYLPFDVTTDANTTAYYIPSVSNGFAKLTATDNEGHDIPANTAVVIINEASNQATFSVTSGLTQQVAESDNQLKGTLISRTLDLSDGTPYYSLGRKDGAIGFYKFNSNGTTSITLGANKAYLDTSVSSGAVKGFRLLFDTPTGVDVMDDGVVLSGEGNALQIYDLSGRRVSKAGRGLYIVNGQKVVVK